MLRVPQHEWKMINDINSPPLVLSTVEGLREAFQQPSRNLETTQPPFDNGTQNRCVIDTSERSVLSEK
jgi:hypothetical protein